MKPNLGYLPPLHPLFLVCLLLLSCEAKETTATEESSAEEFTAPYLIVLGIAQDAGYPQAGCQKDCCQAVWKGNDEGQPVSCLGIVDPISEELWVLDATPDFREQWNTLQKQLENPPIQPSGVLLTHAHIGHYTGLMHLGREVMGANQVPVYAMPRLATFLRANGPWEQLVNLENIQLQTLVPDSTNVLNERLQFEAIQVPHRDEYSETVGFRVHGPDFSFLFIPDIDKWDRWERSLTEEIAQVDYAFLDATFFADGELPNRDMSKIPHPFVVETMKALGSLSPKERAKVHFIHLNHTNPLLQQGSSARRQVDRLGFQLARTGQRLPL